MNKLSKKLIIGTAQFKIGYGITNLNKKIGNIEVKKIFRLINNNNIGYFDSAPFYGNSEKVLGDYQNKKKIITKIPMIKDKIITKKNIIKIRKVLFKSIKNLNIKNFYSILLHSSTDLLKPGSNYLIDFLHVLKKDKITKKLGVSIYEKEDFDKIEKKFQIDIIQLPINILDRRLIKNNFLKDLKKRKIEIHARSIFLQGILLEKPYKLPPYFNKFKKTFLSLTNEIKRKKVPMLNASLNFILSINEIDKIIVGINSSQQLNDIIKVFNLKNKKKISIKAPYVFNKKLLDPRLWK